jgi:outer membrane protein
VPLLCALLLVGGGAASADPPTPDLSHPLTLQELVQIARERNLGLAQSQQTVQQARGAYTGSLSGLLPNLSADYSYSRSASNSNDSYFDPNLGRIILGGHTTTYAYSYGLGVSGGTNLIDLPSWYNRRQAGRNLEAARYGLSDSRSTLALSVRQQYYALIRAQELNTVAQSAYELTQEQLRRAQSLFQLGSVARSDVLQAQVNLATNDRDRIASQNAIDQERARLAVLLALPVDAPLTVAEPPPAPDSVTVAPEDELVREAQGKRPDLLQEKAGYEAARQAELASRSQRYPSLGGSYSYSKQRLHPDEVVRSFNHDARWGFNLGVSMPIFDGLQTKGRIQSATAARRLRERALADKMLQVSLDVRVAVIGIRNASEEIRSARQGVSFAEESVRLQKALYEGGGGTLLEWTNAQVELTRARVAQVEAEIDLRLAQAALARALGEDTD